MSADVLWFGDFAHCGLQRPAFGVLIAELAKHEHEGKLLDQFAGDFPFPFRKPDSFKTVGSSKMRRG